MQGISGSAMTTDEAVLIEPIPEEAWECHERAAQQPLTGPDGALDRNLIAQMTSSLFECVTSVAGLADVPATSAGGWDGAALWGFESLADQLGAEAVVVAYCESKGFDARALTHNNPWGYGGLFQMGAKEMALFGFPGASKYDPVDNAYSAATYLVSMIRRGGGWGGWGPWAVVNTSFNDEVNDQVKVPVLPRFVSTDPDYRGRRGPELPAWSVHPEEFEVPSFDGCPFNGSRWPEAQPIAG